MNPKATCPYCGFTACEAADTEVEAALNQRTTIVTEVIFMGIIELLTKVGEANVTVQNVVTAASNFSRNKKGVTAMTIHTTEIGPEAALGRGDKIGLIVWIPKSLLPR